MASIHLQGILVDSVGEIDVGGVITFTHLTTTGDTIASTQTELIIPPDGAYSIDVEYGQIRIDYTTRNTERFVANVIVNSASTATSLPELLSATTPVAKPIIIQMQGLVADATAAATTAEAFADQLTTTELIASSATFAPNTNITTKGYTTSGDGGAGSWVQNGVTGQTVSQSPAQLGNALLNDAGGNQWALVALECGSFSGSALGVLPDSGNVSDAFNAFISFLKSSGNRGLLTSGDIYARNLRLEGGSKAWAMYGAGKKLTKIRHVDGEGTLIIGNNGSSVGYHLEGFTIDCRYTELSPAAANNGLSLADTNEVTIKDVSVIDYLNDAILIFSNSAGTHKNATIENCDCDGNLKAGNGFLISSYENGRIINSFAKNVRATEGAGPGFGLQLKNECVGGGIFGGEAVNCITGAALGFENPVLGVSNSQVKGFLATNCAAAFNGLATNCDIEVITDMSSSGESAINLEGASTGNRLSAVVKNVANSKGAIRYRGTASNNSASLICHGLGTGSVYAIHDASTANNKTILTGYTDSDYPSNGYRAAATFNGTSSNSFIINTIPVSHSFLVIASGAVTLDNKSYEFIKIDTESAAATDDLLTINAGFEDGQILKLTNVNDARAVTLKNNGNIRTLDGLDLVLNDKTKIHSFMFLAGVSLFFQI